MPHHKAALAATILVFLSAIACNRVGPAYNPDAAEYVPDTAGMIVRANPPTGTVLDDGQELTIPQDAWLSPGEATVGYLLMAGSTPTAWAYSIPPAVPPIDVPNTMGAWQCEFYVTPIKAWAKGGIVALLEVRRMKPADPKYQQFRFPVGTSFYSHMDADGLLRGVGRLCFDRDGKAVGYS